MPNYYDITIDGTFAARIVDNAFAWHAYEKYCEHATDDTVEMRAVYTTGETPREEQIAYRKGEEVSG